MRINQAFADTISRGAIYFYRQQSQVGSIMTSSTATTYNTSTTSGIVGVDASTITINTASAERMRIDSAGNVGINTTTINAKVQIQVGDNAPAASGNMNTGVVIQANTGQRAINIGANNTGGYSWINAAFANNSGVADNLVLMTGATERMRIDSNGNVGIGTTTNTTGALPRALEFNYGAISTYNGSEFDLSANAYITTNAWTYKTTAAATLFQQSGGQFSFQSAASGTAGTTCSFTERMRIDSNGNVMIGTVNSNVLDAVGAARPLIVSRSDTNTSNIGSLAAITINNSDTTTSNVSQLNFAASTGAATGLYSSGIISVIHGARTNGQYPTGQMCFSTSSSLNAAPSEKMRIISTGQVGINVIPAGGNTFRVINIGTDNACQFGNASSGVYLPYASPTAWSSYSDARLKDIVGDYENALEHILHLNPIKYTFKSDKNKKVNIGLLAQNVLEVIPEIVDENTLPNDAYDKTKYLSLRYTDLIPVLIGAIQEQQALITTLTERISALETK
jgi:hypothetical protein